MTYWDDDIYETVRKSDRRFERLPGAIKQLIDDIFYTRKIKLIIEQKFFLDLTRCKVEYDGASYRNEDGEGGNGMNNPHIQRFSCFGTHKSIITKYLSEGNVMQAFNQAVAACSGITWTDGTVVEYFFDYFESYKKFPCLELEDGTVISIEKYAKDFNSEGRKYTA